MATDIQEFVTAKRAIARRYLVEEKALRIWDAFLVERGISVDWIRNPGTSLA
jgi:hypothetical protein